MVRRFPDAHAVMQHAIELAEGGIGCVEPNPAVGAVIVDDELNLVGQGYHHKYGGQHAEIHAIQDARNRRGSDSNFSDFALYVTLEPCCHHGQTPPCSAAVIEAGFRKVVIGLQDPSVKVNGRGIEQLRAAGIEVEVGLSEELVRNLNLPFLTLISKRRPYIHAKWAMTLDGKIASRTGQSQWISNTASRQIVHRLRGRMDGIVIGIGTAQADDPLLTARGVGPRQATRIVLDSLAQLPLSSQLARTAGDIKTMLVATESAPDDRIVELQEAGIDILSIPNADPTEGQYRVDLKSVMDELHRQSMTNVLVEGGAEVLGSFFDQQLIDEVHVFIAAKLVGGETAASPLAGEGIPQMAEALRLDRPTWQQIDTDLYLHGRVM